MADWDDEDFEPQDFSVKQSDKWEGEDEEDQDVKENWFDEEEDSEKKSEPSENQTEAAPQAKVKKRKTIKQAIQDKEDKAKERALKKQEENKSAQEEELTEEEQLAEKLRRQKLVEDADLELAKQAFGVKDDIGSKSIDDMKPSTKEEFVELSQLLVGKLSNYEAKKGKKAVKKATLSGASAKAGRKEDLDAFGGGNYDYGDEFDDFM
ncbi:hypothetical protein pdam_00010404 [Pocillopora damicornis]|uniref:Uncharacterized protein n=1 Tax=Pocillopora damicornis TaxID=46731 RepID=A0A3M6UR07_POCDA|nr:hypothetical protein pdam_00010404 [Pocillopora damicornis]